ncbi:MAG TPA: hypothetical protein VIE88_18800 [Vicinamibacteria bacterium]
MKIADELVEEARETAALANRSIAKQIEHWARLGRAVEQLVKTADVMAFKARLADPQDAAKAVRARVALERLVQALADRMDRDAARRFILDTGKPVYEAVPARPDLVSQVWPDGRRMLGRFVDQEFVAEKRTGKKNSRSR